MNLLSLCRHIFNSESAFNLFSSLDNELYVSLGETRKSVLITSATKEEGRSTIALLYAVNHAKLKPESRVLLVNTDYAGGEGVELEEVLSLSSPISAFENQVAPYHHANTAYKGLDYVRTFSKEEEKAVLDKSVFEQFIRKVESEYDLIVVDAASGVYGNDVISLAKIIGNVILVIHHRRSKREQIQELIVALERVGANILGAVLNKRKFALPAWLYGK